MTLAMVPRLLPAPWCLAVWQRAHAAAIVMKNGDHLTGTVERLREGKIELETPYAGTIAIAAGAIESVQTEDVVTIVDKDYSRLIGRVVGGGATLQVQTAAGATVRSVPAARVSTLQLNVDWDGEPSAGRKAVDRQRIFSLGYRW